MKKIFLSLLFFSQIALAQTTAPISIAYVPAGGIVPFQTSCPEGWTVYSRGAGRFLLGAGSGNTDAQGIALKTRNTGVVGGLEYTTGIPASTFNSTLYTPSSTLNLATIGSFQGRTFVPTTGYVSNTFEDTTINGPKANSNMPPYFTVIYCKKN